LQKNLGCVVDSAHEIYKIYSLDFLWKVGDAQEKDVLTRYLLSQGMPAVVHGFYIKILQNVAYNLFL